MRFLPVMAAALCLSGFGQEPGFQSSAKAPEETNEALKARVTGYYQAFVDGKFRKADEFVSEDSKDGFFAMEKKTLREFEILDILYSDNFTKAKVITKITTDVRTARMGTMKMQPVQQTTWRLENGTWYWYDVPGTKVIDSPFGKMTVGPMSPSGPTILGQKRVSADDVLQLVTIDTETVSVSPEHRGTASVAISNKMPGAVTAVVEAYPTVPGLTVGPEKQNIASNQTGQIRFQFKGHQVPPAPLTVNVLIQQTGKRFPVQVSFNDPK